MRGGGGAGGAAGVRGGGAQGGAAGVRGRGRREGRGGEGGGAQGGAAGVRGRGRREGRGGEGEGAQGGPRGLVVAGCWLARPRHRHHRRGARENVGPRPSRTAPWSRRGGPKRAASGSTPRHQGLPKAVFCRGGGVLRFRVGCSVTLRPLRHAGVHGRPLSRALPRVLKRKPCCCFRWLCVCPMGGSAQLDAAYWWWWRVQRTLSVRR